MKLSTALLVALSTSVLGLPEAGMVKPSDWRPKGPNDVRSPCPGLNALANHGFLPHSGKGLTIDILKRGFKNGLNVGHDFAVFAGKMGIELSSKKNSFDLDDLNVHNAIEHDASFSRQDAYFGNFHTFNKTIFDGTAQFFKVDTVDIKQMAKARTARVRDSQATNPNFSLNMAHKAAGFTEGALIVSIFGHPHTGLVKHPKYIDYWFRNRRLPYELGWSPRVHETNLTSLEPLMKKMIKATPKDARGPFEDMKFRVH